jgi:3-phenylpropionate/trans-cinnamate dioxygenase ferredoxin reductase component
MIYRDYLIVGAGLAGASVCQGIRMHDKKGSVMLAGGEPYLPYHRPPLSKVFLRNPKYPAEKLVHLDAEWYGKNHIDLRIDTPVREFNIERRLAVLADGQAVEFRKACIATGSHPRRPAVAGATLGNVFYLRTIRDALAIREIAPMEKGVVIVGGGFIAIETAAALRQAGHKVTLLNRNRAIWEKWIDPDTAQWLTGYFASNHVTMMMGEDLNGFEGKTALKNVQTKSGNRFPAAMALVAVGADPNLDIVLKTPLSTPAGTPVNEYLESDEKGIYAAGDIALYPDRIFGGVRRTEHWDNAKEQGLVAGQNITGKKRIKFDYVPYFFSDLFDLAFEFVGDFSRPPTCVDIEGDRAKKKFVARYLSGSELRGVVLCGQEKAKVDAAKKEFLDRL